MWCVLAYTDVSRGIIIIYFKTYINAVYKVKYKNRVLVTTAYNIYKICHNVSR